MGVEGSRVGIVGGSIAGCAAAIALGRAGCEVTVFERSGSELSDRGVGIGILGEAQEELIADGYLDADTLARQTVERVWMVRDEDSPTGRVAWRQPWAMVVANWGMLWRSLRVRLGDGEYRQAASVGEVERDGDGVVVVLADGSRERFDVVVGADGYRSSVRNLVDVHAKPVYAGYSLWRGTYPEERLPGPVPSVLDGDITTVCFPGGHAIVYLIPAPAPGGRIVNWAAYHSVPGTIRFDEPTSFPPGAVPEGLLAELEKLVARSFPPYWAEVVRRTGRESVSLQPIYDTSVARYAQGRMLLAGDAGVVARPHTGAGAVKALQDALALERLCGTCGSWDEVLAGYDGLRCEAANGLVELGQRLGRAQVERTPAWHDMTEHDFRDWVRATLDRRGAYAHRS